MKEKSILDIYCQEMSKVGRPYRLTVEQTKAYFTEYENVCQALDTCEEGEKRKFSERKRKLIELISTSCLPYVLRLAQNYTRGTDDKELLLELLAEGNVGLCLAVAKYDWRRGVPFHNYASFWIKANYQSIIKAHQNMVKNSDASMSVYIDGIGEGQRLPEELQESVDDHGLDVERSETLEEIRAEIKNTRVIPQMVFRLCEGFAFGRDFKFSNIRRMFGVGFSASVGKRYHSEASSSISEGIRSRFSVLEES